jgi:hypothetical protein
MAAGMPQIDMLRLAKMVPLGDAELVEASGAFKATIVAQVPDRDAPAPRTNRIAVVPTPDACASVVDMCRVVINDSRIGNDGKRTICGGANVTDWNAEAKGILKAEIVRRHLTYRDVVERLAVHGVTETEANLRNKISRGGFSAGFFVSCLVSIGVHSVRLHEAE